MYNDFSTPSKKRIFKSVWEHSSVSEQISIINELRTLDKDVLSMIMASPCEAVRFSGVKHFLDKYFYRDTEKIKTMIKEAAAKDESELINSYAIEINDDDIPQSPEDFFSLSEAMRLRLLRQGNVLGVHFEVGLLIQILEYGINNNIPHEELDGYLRENLDGVSDSSFFKKPGPYWENLDNFPKEFLDTLVENLPCQTSVDIHPTLEEFKSLKEEHQRLIIEDPNALSHAQRLTIALDPATDHGIRKWAVRRGFWLELREAIRLLNEDINVALELLGNIDWEKQSEPRCVTNAYAIAEALRIIPAIKDPDDPFDKKDDLRSSILYNIAQSVLLVPSLAKVALYRKFQGITFLVNLLNKSEIIFSEFDLDEEEWPQYIKMLHDFKELELNEKLKAFGEYEYDFSKKFERYPEFVKKLNESKNFSGWWTDIDEIIMPAFLMTAEEHQNIRVISNEWPPNMGVSISNLPKPK